MPFILPDEKLQVIIRQALNENINTRDRDLEAIKMWLKQQPHLPNDWDETGLTNFLRGCDFSIERAKKKIDTYFTMRSAASEFFVGRDVTRPEFAPLLKLGNMSYLPGLTPNGRRVAIVGAAFESDYSDFATFCKFVTMCADVRLITEKYGVSGDVYILDTKVSVLKNFLRISPTLFKKFFICVQDGYPVKIKEVHIVNSHPFVSVILSAVKPLLKEKLRSRIHIHDDMEKLYDFVPKNILPEEYGGSAGKLSEMKEAWLRKLEEFTPWFKEQEKVVADCSKRIGDLRDYDNLFGIEGSFKELTID